MSKKFPPLLHSQEADPPDEELIMRECHEDLIHELLGVIGKRETPDEEEALNDPFEAVSLLRDAVRERASDIHLDTQMDGVLVRLRIDGTVLDGALLDHPSRKRLGNQLKVMCGLDPVAKYLPEEGRSTYAVDGCLLDLRMAHAPCLNGDKISVRILDPRLGTRTLTQLGLQSSALEHIQDWLDDVHGILLVAGPTGSGKTTTLYALLNRLKLQKRMSSP